MQASNATMSKQNSIIVLSYFILKSLLCIWLCFSRDKWNYCGIFWILLSVFERKCRALYCRFSPWVFIHYLSDQFTPLTAPEMKDEKSQIMDILNIVQNRVLVIFFLFTSCVQEYYEKYLCECKLPTFFNNSFNFGTGLYTFTRITA